MDLGNHLLDLDLVVRDTNQNIYSLRDSLSIIKIFREYHNSSNRLKDINPAQDKAWFANNITQIIDADETKEKAVFLQVKNVVCKVGEEAELMCFVAKIETTR